MYKKILCLIIISILNINQLCMGKEKEYFPNRNAYPVTENCFPKKKIKQNVVSYIFNRGIIIRRVLILLNKKGTKIKSAKIRFKWITREDWENVSGYFVVERDSKYNCFFLGSYVGIPENVEVKKIYFEIPTGVQVEKISFSSFPSERKILDCPMPGLKNKTNKAYEACKKDILNRKKAELFVNLLKKTMYTYDCRREYDYESVPAWYLVNMEDAYKWFVLLSELEIKEARELFNSKLFINTLDGEFAEWYYNLRDKERDKGTHFNSQEKGE